MNPVIFIFLFSTIASGFFVDGEGHLGVRPLTLTSPAFHSNTGLYQATETTFRLLGDFKANDALSLKVEMRLFDEPYFLGDYAQICRFENGERKCTEGQPDLESPGYVPMMPRISRFYAVYGMEVCRIEIGRRPRHWGKGFYLNDGNEPFAVSSSTFDGLECALNTQRSQTLGFRVGIDRISETIKGRPTGAIQTNGEVTGEDGGPTLNGDDFDQIYFAIEYDDTLQATDGFRRKIGIYLANLFGTSSFGPEKLEGETEMRFADLYTGLYWNNLRFENEVVFRLGKSADNSWTSLGGVQNDSSHDVVKSRMDAIAFAGELGWGFSQSGTIQGPPEYRKGNFSGHELSLLYAYAPGDRDGYFDVEKRREKDAGSVTAFAFHPNFRPAKLLLSNGRHLDEYNVDGIFDAGRVMNMTLYRLGYHYSSFLYGDFDVHFVTADLATSAPGEVVEAARAAEDVVTVARQTDPTRPHQRRPIGLKGSSLGYELNLSYTRQFEKGVSGQVGGAIAIPGLAWDIEPDRDAEPSYLLEAALTVRF